MCPPLVAAIPALISSAGAAVAAGGTAAAGAVGLTATQGLAALSIASMATSMYSQQQAGKAQAKAIGRQEESERQEAKDRAEEQLGETIKAQRQARARALVAAGESGVGGQSFIASINQSIQDQDMAAALAAKNVAFANRATSDRASTARAGIRNPSALEAGLNIASAGVSGYQTGLSIEKLKDGKA